MKKMRRLTALVLTLAFALALTFVMVPGALAEGTDDEIIEDVDVEPTPEVVDPPDDGGGDDVDDIIDDPTPEVVEVIKVVRTGDPAANVAVAVAAAAIIAAAGMSFILKKVR